MTTSMFRRAAIVAAAAGLALSVAGCASKPSLEEYKEGLFAVFTTGMATSDAAAVDLAESYRPYTDCFAEQSYEEISAEGAKAMISTDVEKLGDLSEADSAVLSKAGEACADKLAAVIGESE